MILWLGGPAIFFYALSVALWARTPQSIPVGHPHHALHHVAKCIYHPHYAGRWRFFFRALAVGSATLGNAFLLALCLH